MFRKSTILAFRGASIAINTNIRDKSTHLLRNVCLLHSSKNVYSFSVPTRPFSTTQRLRYAEDESLESTLTAADKEKRLKVLKLEMDVSRQEGRRAPDPETIKPDQWEHILSLNSKSQRHKYYAYLWQIEKRNENAQAKKEIQRKKRMEELELKRAQDAQDNHLKYHLGANTMFLRLYDATIDKWNNHKLVQAMQFGQKLVIDCSYDSYMIPREAKNAAKQLCILFAENRQNEEPFDLHFCNVKLDGVMHQQLLKYIPVMHEPTFPINIHTDSYLDLFPKEKLVYLTPHCRNDLTSYSHDDIYIVGAMVDKINNEPLSLAKAKSQGLRMARLPLDHYLQWGSGSGKSLTINQMLNILLDMKKWGDWNKALKHVPRRKLQEYRTVEPMQQKLEKFKNYRYDFETWGAKKLIDHSSKRVDKRLNKKVRVSEILEH